MLQSSWTFQKVMFSSTIKTKELHDNVKKIQMTFLFIQGVLFFLQKVDCKWDFANWSSALILDGHVSHLTSKTIEQAQAFVLNMGTFPSHTSRALQTLIFFLFQTIQREEDQQSHTSWLFRTTKHNWITKAIRLKMRHKQTHVLYIFNCLNTILSTLCTW